MRSRRSRPVRLLTVVLCSLTTLASGCVVASDPAPTRHSVGFATPSGVDPALAPGSGIHKIRHVVIIMQENRSFDSYFGTYPGADGIPMQNGVPTVCVPDAATGSCVPPFHDTQDVNAGGPHGNANALADINQGKMDGFVAQMATAKHRCQTKYNPACANPGPPDVMGYHNGSDIPNYWSYAHNFVLQDHLFESTDSWSLPSHLYLVSAWSAICASTADPTCCSPTRRAPTTWSLSTPGPTSPICSTATT